MKKISNSRKNKQKDKLAITTLVIIVFLIYVLIFMYFVHIKKQTFKCQKAEILISAGYSVADVDNVVVWWQSGHYYVNGQHCCGNYQITTGIDNLLKTKESFEIFELLMILIGILLIILLKVMYHYVVSLIQHEFDSRFLLEQQAIKKKRDSIKIYNYMEENSSEVIETHEPNSEDYESKEHDNSED